MKVKVTQDTTWKRFEHELNEYRNLIGRGKNV